VRAWLAGPTPWGVWLATCLTIGLLFAGGAFLYVRLQSARVDAIERLCLADNQHARDNQQFIHAVSPDLDHFARRTFKINADCHEFARRTANQPPPQPGAP
jgi:hypothetical protein